MKLSLDPLMVLPGLDVATIRVPCRQGGFTERKAGQALLAERLSRPRTTVRQWCVRGVSLATAEDICTCFGLHPVEVWGDTWIDAVLEGIPDDATL